MIYIEYIGLLFTLTTHTLLVRGSMNYIHWHEDKMEKRKAKCGDLRTQQKWLTLKEMQNAEGAHSFLRTESIFGTWVSRMSREPAADSILCSACVIHLHVKLMNEIRFKTVQCYLIYTIIQLTCSCTSSYDQLSLIHIWRCRRSTLCRSRWSPYH